MSNRGEPETSEVRENMIKEKTETLDDKISETSKMLDRRIHEAIVRFLSSDKGLEFLAQQISEIIQRDPNGPLAEYVKQRTAKV